MPEARLVIESLQLLPREPHLVAAGAAEALGVQLLPAGRAFPVHVARWIPRVIGAQPHEIVALGSLTGLLPAVPVGRARQRAQGQRPWVDEAAGRQLDALRPAVEEPQREGAGERQRRQGDVAAPHHRHLDADLDALPWNEIDAPREFFGVQPHGRAMHRGRVVQPQTKERLAPGEHGRGGRAAQPQAGEIAVRVQHRHHDHRADEEAK